MVEFTNNFFEIFGQPVGYKIDALMLAERYRELQKEFHPDRAAAKPEAEQLVAVRWAATINQAFDTLRCPLKRAQYLLELEGIDGTGDATVTNDPTFLMAQMELRESLSDIPTAEDPFAALESMRQQAQMDYFQLQTEFDSRYNAGDFNAALDVVAKMQFFTKLLNEIELLEEDLEEQFG